MKRWLRRLIGLHVIRKDILDLAQDIATLKEQVAAMHDPVNDGHLRIQHLQSFFGDMPDDEPLVKSDFDSRNPWDAT